MTGYAMRMLRQILICPGSSNHDIAETVFGKSELANIHLIELWVMSREGLIVSEDDVIGFLAGGRPLEGVRYYPTSEGTRKALLDYIVNHPGCSDFDLDAEFAHGRIAEWTATDIDRLQSEGMIVVEDGEIGVHEGCVRYGRRYTAIPRGDAA